MTDQAKKRKMIANALKHTHIDVVEISNDFSQTVGSRFGERTIVIKSKYKLK